LKVDHENKLKLKGEQGHP